MDVRRFLPIICGVVVVVVSLTVVSSPSAAPPSLARYASADKDRVILENGRGVALFRVRGGLFGYFARGTLRITDLPRGAETEIGVDGAEAMRRVLAAESRFGPIGGILFILGIIFGFVTAVTGSFDLTASWLLIAYGLVVLVLATGIAFHGPRARRLQTLAAESPEEEPSEALRMLIRAPSARVISAIDGLMWLALVYVMVVKPFR
jgi:hypothetical protein